MCPQPRSYLQNHSATHLLPEGSAQAFWETMWSRLVPTWTLAGCVLTLPIFRHDTRMEIKKVEELVNQKSRHPLPVVAGYDTGGITKQEPWLCSVKNTEIRCAWCAWGISPRSSAAAPMCLIRGAIASFKDYFRGWYCRRCKAY